MARREAITTTKSVTAASVTAAEQIRKLKESEAANIRAYEEQRKSLLDISKKWQQAVKDKARSEAETAYVRTTQAVNEELTTQLVGTQKQRSKVSQKLNAELDKALEPLRVKEKALLVAAQTVMKKQKEFPADQDIRAAAEKARREYEATAAVSRDIELNARDKAQTALDEKMGGVAESLEKVAAKHKEGLAAAYSRALERLAAVPLPEPDLGSSLTNNAAAYDGLVNYVESVEKAADSLRDYIASNSLGTGSFFADFFKSFGKGLISGAINVNSGKGTDMSEAKDSLKALRDSVLSSLKDELASGKDSLKNALHDTATSVLEQAITKATEAAKQAVDDLTKTKNKTVEETAN